MCVAPPINIAHNVTFLVDNASLKSPEDLKCDDMGAWDHTGTPKKEVAVTYTKDGTVDNVTDKCPNDVIKDKKNVVVKRVYYVNKTSRLLDSRSTNYIL